jgi:hypothetical protein
MAIEYDEQGRPCLSIFTGIKPATAHDDMALTAAIQRSCDAVPGSAEHLEAIAAIRAIAARSQG